MATKSRSRCDRIIELIDACLAEVSGPREPGPAVVPVAPARVADRPR